MLQARTALASLVLVAAVGVGCNQIFNIQQGSSSTSTGGAGGGSGSTTSTSGSTSSTSSTSTASSTSTTSSSTSSTTTSLAIVVSPVTTTLLPVTTMTFTATAGGAPVTVNWTVVEANGGTVSSAGLYQAPSAPGTYHVKATSQTDATDFAVATVTVEGTVIPHVIVPTGAVPNGTGNGSQTHLVYAAGAQTWWLFYQVAGAPTLGTSYGSADFTTWAAGNARSLPISHTSNGTDLSVSYGQFSGQDVVHMTLGYLADGGADGRWHLKATVGTTSAAFGSPNHVNGGDGSYSTPDGASTIVLSDGTVIDTSGWQNTPYTAGLDCGAGDSLVYTAYVTENGSTSFDTTGFAQHVVWCVNSVILARQLLSIGGRALLLYVDGYGGQPINNFLNVRALGASTWNPDQVPPVKIFSDAANNYDLDDWVGAAQGTTLHVVRRLDAAAGTFEHRLVTNIDAPAPVAGPTIPPMATRAASGLVLVPYGAGMMLLALTPDGSTVLYTAYNGTKWSSWTTLFSDSSTTRNYIAGYAPPSGAKPAIIWTQPAGGGAYAVGGAILP